MDSYARCSLHNPSIRVLKLVAFFGVTLPHWAQDTHTRAMSDAGLTATRYKTEAFRSETLYNSAFLVFQPPSILHLLIGGKIAVLPTYDTRPSNETSLIRDKTNDTRINRRIFTSSFFLCWYSWFDMFVVSARELLAVLWMELQINEITCLNKHLVST